MAPFEYLVCNSQQGRVTFANGQWIGTVSPHQASEEAALASCPAIWEFLNEKGMEGWELASVTTENGQREPDGVFSEGREMTRSTMLYLKRPKSE
jgi:hypothetical protein